MPNPYQEQPPHAFWKRGVSSVPRAKVDPAVGFGLRVNQRDKIVTAGSCFAQHIARRLQAKGFNYFVTETCHAVIPKPIAKDFNYGTFSARYGNIYTSRQLLQLFDRVYGAFTPLEDVWTDGDRFIDPYRPNIQPNGFATKAEYDLERERHYEAVKTAFEELDVFVFTLGLTECWVSKEDGAAFPLCPGVAGGVFDPARHEMINLSVGDVVDDFTAFETKLRGVNPRAKIIITVSPVPLIATATDQHVLTATTYSKSVLRAAAGELCAKLPDCHYFPSYEIITGAFNHGTYFAEDLRDVNETGVNHVMGLFFKHATDTTATLAPEKSATEAEADKEAQNLQKRMNEVIDIVCDEESIAAFMKP